MSMDTDLYIIKIYKSGCYSGKIKKQRSYTKHFKEETIKADSYAQVAKNLGIPEATLKII
jgi:hypothetical protein